MCPTTLGRVHTRVATLSFLPALLGLILWPVTGRLDWLVLLGLYGLLGVALDVLVYSWAVRYQPPWMTFVLGLSELGLLYVIARVLDVGLTPLEAIAYFCVSWLLAVATKIALLPLVSLTYLESAGEFRREQWSIPPELERMPVLPSATAGGRGAVVDAVSSEAPSSSRNAARKRLILVEEGVEPRREYALRKQLTIGRAGCDISIDHPEVERRHAVIDHFSSGFGIRRVQSDAAVVVNDQPVTGVWVLAEGDRISVGRARLRVESARAAPMRPGRELARGDVAAPDTVPKTVQTLVEAAGGPSGEFAVPIQSRRRRRNRRSQATQGYATMLAYVILVADAIAVTFFLANNP